MTDPTPMSPERLAEIREEIRDYPGLVGSRIGGFPAGELLAEADRLKARHQSVATALSALGAAYRGDWSDFDGRSLRHQLDDLAGALLVDEPFVLSVWFMQSGICPENLCWTEHCPTSISYETCDHTPGLLARTERGETDA